MSWAQVNDNSDDFVVAFVNSTNLFKDEAAKRFIERKRISVQDMSQFEKFFDKLSPELRKQLLPFSHSALSSQYLNAVQDSTNEIQETLL